VCTGGVDRTMESVRCSNTRGGEPAGALIASMPPNLVHRLIINLVNGTKKVCHHGVLSVGIQAA
jgi:hypothetical protein